MCILSAARRCGSLAPNPPQDSHTQAHTHNTRAFSKCVCVFLCLAISLSDVAVCLVIICVYTADPVSVFDLLCLLTVVVRESLGGCSCYLTKAFPLSLSVCLSVSQSLFLSVCLSVCLSLTHSLSLSHTLSPLCRSVFLSVLLLSLTRSLSLCLSHSL